MNSFRIGELSSRDAAAYREIRLEALRLHPDAFGASFENETQQPESFFAARLTSNRVFAGYDSENRLQGIIGLNVSPSPKMRHITHLWGMYVRAEMRGSGLSRELVAAAIQAAHGSKTIKLSVGASNHAAQALYRSSGFKVWATDSAALCRDGVYLDELLMRLDLD
ncbi:hypothetical protein BTJ39_10155 [Izhakiella australiensis]|uniref:N-acetyltransferase domain-containing protein n=1 Tax=Izhakiella australiensis TaxID=1926881 RepID=A0A1S8YN80_9GAMM|nr:GNAT family N-acetyltransferase [Izhakiella australiensis]OON40247.1 hypothetical protein BTJ39_10155 [Izhakiella australiensis]